MVEWPYPALPRKRPMPKRLILSVEEPPPSRNSARGTEEPMNLIHELTLMLDALAAVFATLAQLITAIRRPP